MKIATLIREFFLFCSGANKEILERPECAIDYGKFVGIGATVFFTSALSFLSGGYAFYLVFRSTGVSLLCGLVWASIIFYLDRYTVSTIRRRIIPPNLSLLERIRQRRDEVYAALPRLVLAVLISPVIALPLQLRLFEREISARVVERGADEIAAAKRRAREQFPDIADLEKENERLRREVADKRSEAEASWDSVIDSPSPLTDKMFEERRRAFLKVRAQFQELKKFNETKIAANDEKLASLNEQAQERERRLTDSVALGSADGLLARMEALNDLKARRAEVAFAGMFLILFFILLETSPVLIKLLSDVGPYEYFWDAVESMAATSGRGAAGAVGRAAAPEERTRATESAAKLAPESGGDSSPPGGRKPAERLRAFLCHSSRDKPAIRDLCKRLKADNIDAWLDEEKILPGQNWQQEIKKAVRTCDVVVMCLSSRSVNKAGYVQKEMRYVIEVAGEQPEGAIFLIPARLDECDLPDAVRAFQWVNLFEDGGYERLMLSLSKSATDKGVSPG